MTKSPRHSGFNDVESCPRPHRTQAAWMPRAGPGPRLLPAVAPPLEGVVSSAVAPGILTQEERGRGQSQASSFL